MLVRAVHPFGDEAVIFVADKNFWSVTARSVLFSQFDCCTERLSLAWESSCNVAIGVFYLPLTAMVHHDIPRFVQGASSNCSSLRIGITRRDYLRFMRPVCLSMGPSGRVAFGADESGEKDPRSDRVAEARVWTRRPVWVAAV
jgi:hypothetical protein